MKPHPQMPDGSVDQKSTLSTRQKALADAYCRNVMENLNFTQAELATAAGYASNDLHSLKVMASRTLRMPHVQAYIREQARLHLSEGGMEVAVALRELTTQRDDKRVRLDAAKAVGLAIGLTAREDAGGNGIAVNLIFAGNGAALVQRPGDAAQVIEQAAQSREDRSLAKGEGQRPAVRMITAPPIEQHHAPSQAQGGVGGGGGDRGGEREREGGPSSLLPPETVGVVEGVDGPKISRPVKPRVVGKPKPKVAPVKKKKARSKAKKRPVVSAEVRAAASERMRAFNEKRRGGGSDG